jgi:hypothetical protein
MKIWNYALRRRKIYCRVQYRNREAGPCNLKPGAGDWEQGYGSGKDEKQQD